MELDWDARPGPELPHVATLASLLPCGMPIQEDPMITIHPRRNPEFAVLAGVYGHALRRRIEVAEEGLAPLPGLPVGMPAGWVFEEEVRDRDGDGIDGNGPYCDGYDEASDGSGECIDDWNTVREEKASGRDAKIRHRRSGQGVDTDG